MRYALVCVVYSWIAIGWLSSPPPSFGHGTPILVDVLDGQLVVENGTPDDAGFAPMIFADPLEDTAFIPAPGDILLTDFPGLEIQGLAPGDGLSLQALARPVLGSDPIERRLLWYWNPSTEEVEIAPNEETLRVLSTRGFGEFTLPQAEMPMPEQLMVAEPRESDLGEHRHLLYYALKDSPPAATGVYGFFSQLHSPAYESSLPFLIALNNGVTSGQLFTGALAINAAAADPMGLAGDYNGNGTVEQADLDLVLLHWGQDGAIPPEGWIADLPTGLIDQEELDRVLIGWGDSEILAATASRVPEPGAPALLAVCLSCMLVQVRRRWRRMLHWPKIVLRTVCCGLFAGHAMGHGVPVNVFLNDQTNQLYTLPNFESGPLIPFLDSIATPSPGISIANPGNGLPDGAQVGVNVTQPLLYSDGTAILPAPTEMTVQSPIYDGYGNRNVSPVESYVVSSETGFQEGMRWGTYQSSPPGWEADGQFRLAFSHREPGFWGAPAGIYGLVIQVASPGHLPSDPFLLPMEYDPFSTIPFSDVLAAIDELEQRVLPLATADFDVDRDVDGDDLLALVLGMGGGPASRSSGDANSDGIVDRADFAVWRSQLGFYDEGQGVVLGDAPGGGVPEPASLPVALMVAILSAYASWRRGCLGLHGLIH